MIKVSDGKESFRIDRLNTNLELPVVETHLAFNKIANELKAENKDNYGVFLERVVAYVKDVYNQTITLGEATELESQIEVLWTKKKAEQAARLTSMLEPNQAA